MTRYGAWLTLLARDPGHLRRAPAPAFWALAPHYVGQFNDTSCSVASATMLVNAVRGTRLAGAEKAASQEELLARVADPAWTAGCASSEGRGVSLAEIGPLLGKAFLAYDIVGATLETVPVEQACAAGAAFRQALARMESTPGRLMLVNFLSGAVYGAGEYGHFSPLGAFEAERDRLLVLDVDRGWYEPYWAPVETMLAAMATVSPIDGARRGYVTVTLPTLNPHSP